MRLKKLEMELIQLIQELNRNNTDSLMNEISKKEKEGVPEKEITELKNTYDIVLENALKNKEKANYLKNKINFIRKINSEKEIKNTLRNFIIKNDTKSFLKIQKELFLLDLIKKEIYCFDDTDLLLFKDNELFENNIEVIKDISTYVDLSEKINLEHLNNNLNISLKENIQVRMNSKLCYENEGDRDEQEAKLKASKELLRKSKSDKNKALKTLKENYKAEIMNKYNLQF